LESRYKKIFYEKNELSVNYVRIQQEKKTLEGQKHSLETLLDKVNSQLIEITEKPIEIPNTSDPQNSSYALMEKLMMERNKASLLDKEYKFLLTEYMNLKSLYIDNWKWIMDVNNE